MSNKKDIYNIQLIRKYSIINVINNENFIAKKTNLYYYLNY